jgi:hypothetical protein
MHSRILKLSNPRACHRRRGHLLTPQTHTMQKSIISLLLVVGITFSAQAQTPIISSPQGGFIAGKYGIEASYNMNSFPRGTFGANQIRIGGKFDGISLGIGLHERQQADYADTGDKLNSVAIDLGYDWAWVKQFGVNIMAMHTFADNIKVADNSRDATIKENVTALSFLFYKQINFGNFFLKPSVGIEFRNLDMTIRKEEVLPIYSISTFRAIIPQGRIGLGLGLKIKETSLFAMPFYYGNGGAPYLSFQFGAAYNFVSPTTKKS